MNKLQRRLGISYQVAGEVSDGLRATPPTLDMSDEIWNVLRAISKAQDSGPGMPAGRWPLTDLPVVRLSIARPDFVPDFFQLGGLYYVSAAFRVTAAKAGARAQYVSVDMTECPIAAHAKDYKVLNVIDATTATEPESEGPLALQVVGPRLLYCTAAFATAMTNAELEGVAFYDPVVLPPGWPAPAGA